MKNVVSLRDFNASANYEQDGASILPIAKTKADILYVESLDDQAMNISLQVRNLPQG